MTSRKRFTERQVIATLLLQGAIIPCGCRFKDCQALIEIKDVATIERDHFRRLELDGKDEPANCAYLLKSCHDRKTNGTPATSYGSDKYEIAKAKRIRGETKTRPKRKIRSQGFQKPPPGHKQW